MAIMGKAVVTTTFKWRLKDAPLDDSLSSLFVHILSFPDAQVWIWIGDSSAKLNNMSLALRSRMADSPKAKDILATTVLNPSGTDDWTARSKNLARRLSLQVGGKPVYLSYCPTQSTNVDLLCVDDMELELFKLIKNHPEFF